MSDKVKKLPTNVSVIGSIDKQEMHADVILKQVILSKNLKYVEQNCLFSTNWLNKIQFQTAKPPKFKDKHAVPIGRKVYVPKKSAKKYKKVYKQYKRWKDIKDYWNVY